MATSSILGGSQMPEEISGKDVHALGPSDNSDSGSDAVGAYGDDELASDTDAAGTGERASVGTIGDQPDADILPDRIEPVIGQMVGDELEEMAGDDVSGLSEVEDLADDSEDLDAEENQARDKGDEEAGPFRKA
ncbi:hypothetical protein [Polaromonas sp.]|uniref:hypothetical protein n=1 Tax=Polaromonas sp. TaxID=1869339 RepID=UPI001D7498BC|nr:hypothetical protein [Polaromonas sp.]MBT9475566.1 hypothetical protein [Polaromonas sp.]